jgi:hypothetical protein
MITTHVDLHGERVDPESLEPTAIGMNKRYLPLNVEHDVRIPPIGRIISTEVTQLQDGEYSLEGTIEIFEEADTLDVLAGDGRAVEIPHDDISTFRVEYDRSYETEDGHRLLLALRKLSPDSEYAPVAKKALEPVSTLIIAAGIFIFGSIAKGFFSKLGGELYDGLKNILRGHFGRSAGSATRILDLRFTAVYREDFVEVHVLLEDPTADALESLFASDLAGLDVYILQFNQSEQKVAKFVFQYKNGQLTLLYVMRRDCVPLLPL